MYSLPAAGFEVPGQEDSATFTIKDKELGAAEPLPAAVVQGGSLLQHPIVNI